MSTQPSVSETATDVDEKMPAVQRIANDLQQDAATELKQDRYLVMALIHRMIRFGAAIFNVQFKLYDRKGIAHG